MANSLRRPRTRWQRLLPEFVMTAPALLIFIGMFVIPTILAVYLSMTDWNGFSLSPNFIGLENYSDLFSNPRRAERGHLHGGHRHRRHRPVQRDRPRAWPC